MCTCDRYWSGEDCSVPKCGPDCQDLGICVQANAISTDDADTAVSFSDDDDDPGATTSVTTEISTIASSVITSANPLRNTSECYGNGVCQVIKSADGKDMPMCVCDEAFSFTNPSPSQALCKELLPSVAYIQHFTKPFTVSATLLDLQLAVNAWALYTIIVKDEWEILVANLVVTSTETDAMLFVRKEKLPSVGAASVASSSSYLQFMDSDGWTAGSTKRKIVLSRATSTLSSGLYYIGVFNSAYARANLAYTLSMNVTANCTGTPFANGSVSSNYGICENGGQCNAKSSQVCTCPTGFSGKFCGLKASRTTLSPSKSSAGASQSNGNSSSLAYLAFSMANSSTLDIDAWSYYSFEVSDVNVKLIQIKLLIENDLDTATPVLPLLLVRGPSDDGFPALFSECQQDFRAIASHAAQQVVAIPIETACSYAANLKDCFKVAIYNRQYSGSTLRYRLEVRLFGSTTAMYPLQSCGPTGDTVNCNDNGKCVLVATGATATTDAVPSCQCATGWSGMRCNSPKSFALPQLWSAISNISMLCSVCSSSFSLLRGELKMFRVPESLRENSGLRLRVVTTAGSSTGGVIPSVYVSEVLPRSIYDFSHISIANESSTATGSSSQVLSLPNASFTGHFWVVVYSDYPTGEPVGVSAITAPSLDRRRLERELQMLHSKHSLRLLTTAASSSSDSAGFETGMFQLVAEVYELPDGTTNGKLLTKKSFLREVFWWLFHTPIGLGVFIFVVVFLVLIVSYCLWRICHAPENQDKLTARYFGRNAVGSTASSDGSHAPSGSVALAPIVSTAPVRDIYSPHRQEHDVELGATAAKSTKASPLTTTKLSQKQKGRM